LHRLITILIIRIKNLVEPTKITSNDIGPSDPHNIVLRQCIVQKSKYQRYKNQSKRPNKICHINPANNLTQSYAALGDQTTQKARAPERARAHLAG
jgi:hypothetical protein